MPENTLIVCTSSSSFPKHLVIKDGQRYYDVAEVKNWIKENVNEKELADAKVDPNKTLLTLQECAIELNVSYGTIRSYSTIYRDFPKPAVKIKSRPYFYKEDLEEWRRRKKRSSRLFTTPQIDLVNPKDLLTRSSVADLLGITPQSVSTYAQRKIQGTEDFPKPVARKGRVSYWDKEQILKWNNQRPRKGSNSN